MTSPTKLYHDAYRTVFVQGVNDEKWILKCHVCSHNTKYRRLFSSRFDLDKYWIHHLDLGHHPPAQTTQSPEATEPFPPAKFGPPWAAEIPGRFREKQGDQ